MVPNVGIGVASPSRKFEVSGSNTTGATASITNTSTTGNATTLNVINTSDTTGARGLYASTPGGYTAAIVGESLESGSGTNGIGISGVTNGVNGGAVGVYGQSMSTSSSGSAAAGGKFIAWGSGGTGLYAKNEANTGNGTAVYATVDSATAYSIYSDAGLNYFAGNVGIGTTSPSYGLDVLGTFRLTTRSDETDRIVVNTGTQPSGNTVIRGGSDNNGHGGGSITLGGGANPAFSSDVTLKGGTSGYNTDSGGIGRVFLQGGNDNNNANYAPLVFQNSGGNVGIGIGNTAPAVKLDVSGQIAGGFTTLAANATAMQLDTNTAVSVTVSAAGTYTTTVPKAGSRATIIIVTSGTTSRTITFGAGFKTTGTLATGTTSGKYFTINFVSDGTNFIETSRTTAM